MQALKSMTSTALARPPLLAFIARKGGVGKSTCTALLSCIYASSGLRVAVVDCDPQATTTAALLDEAGVGPQVAKAFGERLERGAPLSDLLQPAAIVTLQVVPGGEVLTMHANRLENADDGVVRVRDALLSLVHSGFDLVMVDTPGNYGVLTFGALLAARWAVVPTYCQKPSARELPKALDVVEEAKALNPALELLGVVANKLDVRTKHEVGVLETLRAGLGERLVEPPIPSATALTNAMEPGGDLDGTNSGVAALLQVAEELLRRHAASLGEAEPDTSEVVAVNLVNTGNAAVACKA